MICSASLSTPSACAPTHSRWSCIVFKSTSWPSRPLNSENRRIKFGCGQAPSPRSQSLARRLYGSYKRAHQDQRGPKVVQPWQFDLWRFSCRRRRAVLRHRRLCLVAVACCRLALCSLERSPAGVALASKAVHSVHIKESGAKAIPDKRERARPLEFSAHLRVTAAHR